MGLTKETTYLPLGCLQGGLEAVGAFVLSETRKTGRDPLHQLKGVGYTIN